ncbi:hypothetical protein ACFTXM_05865 [Streptomyces sp. NPDC056930]|uniref:hypothetical protein n=1 Tax=Streptomyces sp. NPDC056930 TaxID=3345967 RepID=UPI0036387396
MKPAAALLAAAALLSLAACSTEQKDVTKPAPEATAVDHSAAEKAAGIPPAPTGADRAAYLAAIKAVDPRIVEDEEKAIDAGRNQCASLANPNDKDNWAAAQRFGNDTRPLTDAQGKQLNEALRKTLCPK